MIELFGKGDESPPRLGKAKSNDRIFAEKIIIATGIITGLIFLLIMFIIICMYLIPPTHGYYWY